MTFPLFIWIISSCFEWCGHLNWIIIYQRNKKFNLKSEGQNGYEGLITNEFKEKF